LGFELSKPEMLGFLKVEVQSDQISTNIKNKRSNYILPILRSNFLG